MTVRLVLHAILQRKYPAPASPIDTSASTLGELLDERGVPRAEAALLCVNGRRAGPEAPLHEGDEIRAFPLLGGG